MKSKITEVLKDTGIPWAYGTLKKEEAFPFCVYLGSGQDALNADDGKYLVNNHYRVEYYFKLKSAAKEEAFEGTFLEDGWMYDKSEDTYISTEQCYCIYYDVWRNS